jgi:undecaprenyl diphosphate synthase
MSNGTSGRALDSDLHVAIIMDGSGRWAEAQGMPRSWGHRAGRAAVRRAVEAALGAGIRVLTLFTFSTENWGRPDHEVSQLMEIFEDFFRRDVPAFSVRGVRVNVMGRRDRLPVSLCEAIEETEAQSQSGEQLHVRLAIDYSGREAIVKAARGFHFAPDQSAESFGRILAGSLYPVDVAPDIDLLIRTGGERRLSNCPLWEAAYAELYFTPCLWPDFGPADFEAALRDFSTRQRRFGRISTASY